MELYGVGGVGVGGFLGEEMGKMGKSKGLRLRGLEIGWRSFFGLV
jgi:hypothetical protein